MKLYHGSVKCIEKPVFDYGKPYNDYGLGFYCTDVLEMAKEWGVDKERDGVANIYDFEMDDLKVLNLNDGSYCILHWLGLLLQHRTFSISSGLALEAKEYILKHFKVDADAYDVIIGYRADDSYFSFSQDFINGAISYRQLNNAMYLGKLGQQIVLKSNRAFERLHFVGHEVAKAEEWYERKTLRDRTARREYLDVERNKRERGDIYIQQIIDEGMVANDPRLR